MAYQFSATCQFEVDFPSGMGAMIDIDEDLRYIRERIQGYRAINASEISGKTGELYEAGVGMMRLLWYLIRGAGNFVPLNCKVSVFPEDTETEQVGTTIKMRGFYNKEGRRFIEGIPKYFKISIPILIELEYSKYSFNDDGIFSIDINTISEEKVVSTDGQTFEIPSIIGMIGTDYLNRVLDVARNELDEVWIPDAPLRHSVHIVPNGDFLNYLDANLILCIPANPNEALRYSENFPLPSMMMSTAQAVFDQIFYFVTTKNAEGGVANNEQMETKQEVSTDRKWPSGSEEEISEEG